MSDEALNKHLDWLDECAEEQANEPQGEVMMNPSLEVEMTLEKWEDLLGHIAQLESTNADLLDVVRDCVNFLADFHTTAPFDLQFLTVRAKALHKRAYTAHSKAKGG